MNCVLAIDQGTSGTKALVLDPEEGVAALAEEPVRPVYLPGGRVEQDPAELLYSVLAAGRRAIDEAGRTISAVALANQGETVLAWDPRTGEPLSTALVWQDRRAETVCAEMAEHADLVAARTGLVLDPYFCAPKMAWLRRHVTHEGVVTSSDSWLIHRLTGAFVTDAATASRSLLLDLDSVDWSEELAEPFGLAGEALPRIAACDEVVGTTTAFGGEIPVGGLIVDQQAALLAEGCLTPGMAKCTYGTGAFLLANTGEQAIRSTAGLTSSVAWRARGRTPYCLDGQVYAAASAVRWLTDLGLIGDASDLDALADADGEGSGGVVFVPALAGLAAPWWRPDATATFMGMTLASRTEHLVRAVVEGIAAQVADLARIVAEDLGEPLTRLRVDGGLTRSRALMQAQADLLQLPVEVYPSPHATALGAAGLACLAVEPALSLAEAVPASAPARTYEPQWSADRAEALLQRWRRGVQAVIDLERRS